MQTYDRTAKNRTQLKHSDVCLSCRNLRPGRSEQALAAFKPTRVEWSYITSPGFIQHVRKTATKFIGALNTIGGNRSGRDSVNYDGNRLVAPWMQEFDERGGPGWACVNSPDSSAYREQWLKDFLELGVDAIQHDDWAFNVAAFDWGGCFCSHCMKAFDRYLEERLSPQEKNACGMVPARMFHYREYLRTQFGVDSAADYQRRRDSLPLQNEFRQFERASTRGYFERLMAVARQYRGKGVPLAVNANLQPAQFADNFILDLVDYLVGETKAAHDNYLDVVWMLKLSDALNLPQVVSPFPREQVKVNEIRGVLAAVYALGHWPLVPWDVWQGPSKKERWFGTVEEYGDIYEFVRSNSGLFDSFDAWANVALFVPATSDRGPAAQFAERGKELIAALSEAGIPFRTITAGRVGGGLVHIPFDPADFENLRAIFLCGGLDSLDKETRGRFKELTADTRVISTAGKTPAADAVRRARLPAACKADDPTVHLLPRCRRAEPHGVLVVHVLNGDYDKEADEHAKKADVTVQIEGKSLGAIPSLSSAVYHQPGAQPVPLKIERKRTRVEIVVPSLELWGAIELR